MPEEKKKKEFEETVSEEEILEIDSIDQTGAELEPVKEEKEGIVIVNYKDIKKKEEVVEEVEQIEEIQEEVVEETVEEDREDSKVEFTSTLSSGSGDGVYNFFLVASFVAFLSVILIAGIESRNFYDVGFFFFKK